MALIRWSPWNNLFDLHSQVDQLFQSLTPDTAPVNGDVIANLPVDIRQTDDAFIIEASVPGFRPEDVEVTFADGTMTIRGHRSSETEAKEGSYVRRERRRTSVYRQVGLPAEVRDDQISATFDNGVLKITVPRAEKAQPKRIPVSAGKVIDAKS
jgi:HSP20 family protein